MTRCYLSLVLLTLLLFAACKGEKQNQDLDISTKITFKKEGELYLIKASGDTIQKLDIEIADNPYERETGLMHRDAMDDLQGMLFIFDAEGARGFYMKNTLIPLDIIYLNSRGEIVSTVEQAQPKNETTLPSQAPAQYVLELNGGLYAKWGLENGDRISWERN